MEGPGPAHRLRERSEPTLALPHHSGRIHHQHVAFAVHLQEFDRAAVVLALGQVVDEWHALELGIGLEAQKPLADGDGDVVGIERAFDGEEPIALFVLLADADRLIGFAVELLAQLHFDQ